MCLCVCVFVYGYLGAWRQDISPLTLPHWTVLFVIRLLHLDYSKGFGGKYGVQADRQDKSAAGWDHIEKLEKHESQKGKGGDCFLCLLEEEDRLQWG